MTAEELAAVIGADAAMLFMARQGGQRVAVPKKMSPLYVERMGETAATAFIKEFGGAHVYVPAGRNWRILKLARDGMPINQIALAMATSQKHVRDLIRENGSRADGRGMKLA